MFRAEKLLSAGGGTIAPPVRPRQSASAVAPCPPITSTRVRRTDDTPVVQVEAVEEKGSDEGEVEKDSGGEEDTDAKRSEEMNEEDEKNKEHEVDEEGKEDVPAAESGDMRVTTPEQPLDGIFKFYFK